MPARFIDSDAVHCLLSFDRRGLLSVRGSLFFFLTPAYILYPVLLYYFFSFLAFLCGWWLAMSGERNQEKLKKKLAPEHVAREPGKKTNVSFCEGHKRRPRFCRTAERLRRIMSTSSARARARAFLWTTC